MLYTTQRLVFSFFIFQFSSTEIQFVDASNSMAAITRAIKGDVQFFKTVGIKILRNARDDDGWTALDNAISHKHLDCVEEICRRCPELVYQSGEGTAFIWAVRCGDVSMLPAIVAAGGRKIIRSLSSRGDSALYWAVFGLELEMVKFLLEADHDFDSTDQLIAAKQRALRNTNPNAGKIVELLEENERYRSKLQKAVELLKENERYQSKLRPQKAVEENWTPLQKAASIGDIDAVKEMIESSPKEIELVDDENRNFVHIAAEFGQTEIIKFVLEEADILSTVFNAQDKYGNTPLHVAALYGNLTTALCLNCDTRVLKETLNAKGQNFLDAVCAYGREQEKGVN